MATWRVPLAAPRDGGLLGLLVLAVAVSLEPWPLLLVAMLFGNMWGQLSRTRPLVPPVVIDDHGKLMPSQVAGLIPIDERPAVRPRWIGSTS